MRKPKQWKFADLTEEDQTLLFNAAKVAVWPEVVALVREERRATDIMQKRWQSQPTPNAVAAARRSQSYFNSTRRQKVRFWIGSIVGRLLKPFGLSYSGPFDFRSPVHRQVREGVMAPPARWNEGKL